MTAPVKPNAELAYQALHTAIKHDALYMGTWVGQQNTGVPIVGLEELTEPSCGATACLAGWAAALRGYKVAWRGQVYDAKGLVVSHDIQSFAAHLLGITAEQASELFHCDDDEVEDMVAEIFGPRPGSYGTGCHCSYLGQGTPEHAPSGLCLPGGGSGA